MPNPKEVELIERCRGGQERAFREIVERYQRRTYWIAHNMLNNYQIAQDVSQEAFIRVFRNLHRFDTKKNFYTWLYQIVVNLCIDHLRKRSHGRPADLEKVGGVADGNPGPTDSAGRSELRDRVRATLHRLPTKYKAVLTLRDIQGFSCEEIAEIVGCTNATARWRLHRARKLSRVIWDGNEIAAGRDEDVAAHLR